MTKKKKRTKSKTPTRTSSRKRQRTVKGAYYDEHVMNGNTSADDATNSDDNHVLEVSSAGEVNSIAASTTTHEHTTPVTNNTVTTDAAVMCDESLENDVEALRSARSFKFTDVPLLNNVATPVLSSMNSGNDSMAAEEELSRSSVRNADENSTVSGIIPVDGSNIATPKYKSCSSTPSIVHKIQETKHFATTPIGVARQRSKSLREELEIAMSVDRDRLENRFLHHRNTFPQSVVDVDINLVKEIHFDKSREITVIENPLQILNNVYMLYMSHTNAIDNLFSLGSPASEEPCFGKKSTYTKNKEDEDEHEVEIEVNANVVDVDTVVVDGVKPQVETADAVPVISTQEKFKIHMLTVECDALKKQLFEQQQQLKIANNRVSQVEDTNAYRREVVRLENVLEDYEKRNEELCEELEKVKEELKTTNDSLSDFITENTVLKNQMKLHKQVFDNSGTQTAGCGNGYVCTKCEENGCLIDELIKLLDGMELSIQAKDRKLAEAEYTLGDINELVQLLAAIEKSIVNQVVNNDEIGSVVSGMSVSEPGEMKVSTSMASVSSTIHPLGQGYLPNKKDDSLYRMNNFHSVQYVNNNNFDDNRSIPLRPGPHLYSETVKNTSRDYDNSFSSTMIITDSMAGGIKMSHIKKNIGVKDREVVIKRFPGHTAEEMACYAPKPLSDKKPDQVIIIAGTNDLTRSMYDTGNVDEYEVVDNILKLGRAARDYGAQKIYVSGIMARRGYKYGEQ